MGITTEASVFMGVVEVILNSLSFSKVSDTYTIQSFISSSKSVPIKRSQVQTFLNLANSGQLKGVEVHATDIGLKISKDGYDVTVHYPNKAFKDLLYYNKPTVFNGISVTVGGRDLTPTLKSANVRDCTITLPVPVSFRKSVGWFKRVTLHLSTIFISQDFGLLQTGGVGDWFIPTIDWKK